MILIEFLNYFAEKGNFWRTDKGYSLTDCSSMVIMNNEGIGDVLTADIHFAQEVYKALLAS